MNLQIIEFRDRACPVFTCHAPPARVLKYIRSFQRILGFECGLSFHSPLGGWSGVPLVTVSP